MLKCYRVYYKTYVKGYHIGSEVAKLVTEEVPHADKIVFTWENLAEMYKKYGCQVRFNIWNMRRGRRISFFDAEIRNRKTWDIKEWKEHFLDLTLEIEYREYTPTIDEVTKWYDGDKAIQYLTERGLAIINK